MTINQEFELESNSGKPFNEFSISLTSFFGCSGKADLPLNESFDRLSVAWSYREKDNPVIGIKVSDMKGFNHVVDPEWPRGG